MTQGGQEGRTLDYDTIIAEYQETKSIHKTSENLNIHRESVRRALDSYNIEYDETISAPKEVEMIDPYTLEIKKIFPSIKDAANYIHLSDTAIRKNIKGLSQTCGGYYWKVKGEEKTFIKLSNTDNVNMKK